MIMMAAIVFGAMVVGGCEKTIKEGVNRTAIGAP